MMSSEQIKSYFHSLEAELQHCIKIAREAKMRGADPTPHPEILLAKDLAERVESLVGIEGVAQRIRELESQMPREEAALHIGLDFAEGRIGKKSKLDSVEGAIRTAVAMLTEGIVAAPIEGIARVGLGKNDDGTDYLKIYYSGPIRSAGGTAQALSILVADYVRRNIGISRYKPRKEEVERYVEEVLLYKRIASLQYTPSNEEIRLIVDNCPICIDGEPTEEEEVSAYRNLGRIETNRVRGGMALVLAEGLALKAPKVKTYVAQLGLDGWEWLDALIVRKHRDEKILGPREQFLEDLIAGRPVFSHPSAKGGFRLRYGRSRNSGYATAGIHPATMILLDDFIATGTQMKVELPGKAAGTIPVDSIEGPTVRLVNGDVLRIESVEQAYELRPSVAEIIDVGEILINYGDFLENAHPLVPASYCYEWWVQELGEKTSIQEDLKDITPERAFELSEKFDVPLHPKYTYLWHDITVPELELLANHISEKGEYDETLTIPSDPKVKAILETLLVQHKVHEDNIIIEHALPLIRCLGLDQDLHKTWTSLSYARTMDAVSALSGVRIRERAPIRIGSRMGRPEKSKKREMHPPVHVLFPTGAKDRRRSLNDKMGEIEIELGIRRCPSCDTTTFKNRCDCGERTFPTKFCASCGISSGEKERCSRCGRTTTSVRKQIIDFSPLYAQSLERLDERAPEKFKGVLGLTSKDKTPEPLEKGILRAKHEIYVFKDGTIRYDLTDLPLTHFRPREIGTSLEKLRELGYRLDKDGRPLTDENQVIELRPQDVILSKGAGDYLLRAANFVDDLLIKYYGMEAYHKVQSVGDLIGKLVIGLAPHTSAGVLGRILGFTNASVGYAHPFFHAAKRRNCFHPDTKIWIRGGNQWSYRSIGAFVEEKLAANEVRSDDFGTRIADVCDENIYTPSLNCDTNQIEYRRVTEVSSHEAPSHLLIFKTRSGRKIKVTPEHAMLVSRNGGIKKVQASELEVGDAIPTPKSLDLGGQAQSVDLLRELTNSSFVKKEEVMIRGLGSGRIRELLRNFAGDRKAYLKKAADKLRINKKTLYNYVDRDSIPLDILLDVIGNEDDVLTFVPKNASLGIKRDLVVKRKFDVDRELAKVLGYYTAEGFARKQESSKSFYQVTICTPDEKPRTHIKRIIRDKFGVTSFEENKWKITISSKLIHTIFTNILDCGSSAHEKKIPTIIQNSSNDVLASFLSAYFSGDGSIASNRNDVRACTVSDQLTEDLVASLKRFGIAAKTYETTRTPSGAIFEFYRKRKETPEFRSNIIKITSDNIRTFAEQIGFDLDRKQQVLEDNLVNIPVRKQRSLVDGGEIWLDEVVDKRFMEFEGEKVYCLTVEKNHTLVASDLFTAQCDGDEDCIMLLMDGLLNFSRSYLPDKRGGKMDAPLVLTTRIDPNEIDSEVHNIDLMRRYPLEFYEASLRYADPKDLEAKMDLVGARLSTPTQYEGFCFTHDTSDIAAGPTNSAYKTLGSMIDKMEAQLKLARKVRAVNARDVAERIIVSHFLPDLVGNLRAFSKQKMR
ncbi:MAG: DNA polymerase II large subunit, partial [Methanocellales archaeon]|nr:DNA polymerase II large subunit [Methanocellales archaeon]